MRFRVTPEYLVHWDAFSAVLQTYNGDESSDNLRDVMLVAYNWMKFLRTEPTYGRGITEYSTFKPTDKSVDEALIEAAQILDRAAIDELPLWKDADALELVSFAAYRELRARGWIEKPRPRTITRLDEYEWCSLCQGNVLGGCKKHRSGLTEDGRPMYWCTACGGFTVPPCIIHVPRGIRK